MTDTQGLKKPVPMTISTSPERKHNSAPGLDCSDTAAPAVTPNSSVAASVMWPAAMIQPPTSIERWVPIKRSAIKPPNIGVRYTSQV